MTEFSESLTVRILADAGELHEELDRALERLGQFNQQLGNLGQGGTGLSRLGASLQGLQQPLTQVSSLLTRVTQQVHQLDNIPIRLNVNPALQALSQLSAAIQRVASLLNGLNMGGGGGIPWLPMGGGTGGPPLGGSLPGVGGGGGGGGGPRQLARGGMVQGPAGLDRVPAWLTSGEFVLSRPAVDQYGESLLDAMNRGAWKPPNQEGPARGGLGETTTAGAEIHQYGEIAIHVAQPVPLGELLRDLQFEGHRLRNRRG